MYQCCNCDAIFEEPKVVYERHGLEYPPYEKLYVCPECGVNDLVEVDDPEEEEEDDEGTL